MEQQIIGATTRLLTQTDFPLQSYEPKVQVPFQVLPGQCPRKIEIERYAGELEREAWPKEVASARLEGRGVAHHQGPARQQSLWNCSSNSPLIGTHGFLAVELGGQQLSH